MHTLADYAFVLTVMRSIRIALPYAGSRRAGELRRYHACRSLLRSIIAEHQLIARAAAASLESLTITR